MADQAHCWQEQTFTTARQLLEYLNPLETDRWPPDTYIFRGQPEACMDLLPSVHRLEGPVTAPRFYGYQDVSCDEQVAFEKKVICALLEACDRTGLRVPGDSPAVRESVRLSTTLLETSGSWPSSDMDEILAFAQHHGVPTCLLDWTRSSYVAAYFAASSALARLGDYDKDLDGHLAVWALGKNCTSVDIIQPPGSTSPYLAAQSGLFTVSRILGSGDSLFDPRPMQRLSHIHGHQDAPYHLTRMTLPRSEAGELLKDCALLGVTGSTLFPGYEGIARNVRDWANIEHRGAGPLEDSIRYILS